MSRCFTLNCSCTVLLHCTPILCMGCRSPFAGGGGGGSTTLLPAFIQIYMPGELLVEGVMTSNFSFVASVARPPVQCPSCRFLFRIDQVGASCWFGALEGSAPKRFRAGRSAAQLRGIGLSGTPSRFARREAGESSQALQFP